MTTEAKPRSRRLRRFFLKLSIVTGTMVICLGLAEVAARMLFPQFNPNAQLSFRAMPGGFALGPPSMTEWDAAPKGDFNVLVKFNQYGFRDAKDLQRSTEADWFAVGDSFTLGFGVDEEKRYSDLLEQKLHAAGDPAHVYNIGIPGNFVDYQHLVTYARSRGAKIGHLIIGVCMDNDLLDYRNERSDWADMAEVEAHQSAKDRFRHWLKAHSALYITASFGLEASPRGRRLMEKIGAAKDLVALDAAYKNKLTDDELKTSRDELARLAAMSPDTLVLIIPSRRIWLADKQTEERVHDRFVQLCRDAGLKVVDPKPLFEKDPAPLSFYFEHDPHWTPRGHEIAAQLLAETIHPSPAK